MSTKNFVALILTLALAAANAAPVSAVVTCGMSDEAPGQGCSCDHGTCCPDEAQGPELNARCCTVSLPDDAPVDVATAPLVATDDLGDAPLPIVVGEPVDALLRLPGLSAAATESPPEESPPRYALFCTYLI